jgi:Protein of unknown function DUF262
MPDDVRQTSVQFSLRELVRMTVTGRLRPAAFSRPQVWRPGQVVDLFDSILHGYPIGTMVVIEESAPEEDVVYGDIVIHAPREERALIIVDGLQRINALVGALSGALSSYKDKRFEIYYDVEQEKFATGSLIRDSMLPIEVAADSSSLIAWLDQHPFLSEREIDACWRLSDALMSYEIPMIILAGADARNTAREIFTRINSSGASLTKSDLARVRATRFDTIDLGLERLQTEVERTGFGRMSTALAAECALAVIEESDDIVGSRASPRQRPRQRFRQLPPSLQRDAIDRTRKIIIPTVQFLRQESAIPHIKLLPRTAILPILTRYVVIYGPPAGRARELIRRWVWRSGTVTATNPPLKSSTAFDTQETALSSATSLLDSLPSYPGPRWRPDMSELRLSRINGRLNTLALLSLRPHLLVPVDDNEPADVPISATHIFGSWLDEASSAFSALLPRSFIEIHPISLASYLLHPQVNQAQLFEAVIMKSSADVDVLSGHCIDRNALDFLRRDDFDEFVGYRQSQMFEVIMRRVQSMARWGFRDHGSLPDIPDDSGYMD